MVFLSQSSILNYRNVFFFLKNGDWLFPQLYNQVLESKKQCICFSNTYTEVQQKADSIWKFQYYHLVKDYQRRPPSPILAIYNSIFLLIIGFPLFIRNIRLGCPKDDTATERKVKGRPLHSQNNSFSVFSLFFSMFMEDITKAVSWRFSAKKVYLKRSAKWNLFQLQLQLQPAISLKKRLCVMNFVSFLSINSQIVLFFNTYNVLKSFLIP